MKNQIKELICSKKFSFLYLAIDSKFRTKVFIRELFVNNFCSRSLDGYTIDWTNANSSLRNEYFSLFEEEARFLSHHSNTHLVKSVDMFQLNNTSYYTIEFVEGELLSDIISRRNQPLSDFVASSYLTDILDALSYMHSKGFWHLDLTPSNIIISNEGQVKILDFGHLKLIDNEQTIDNSETFDPEELTNHDIKNIGPWTDFYILGNTLYNILTGKMPPSPSKINETTNQLYSFPVSVSNKMQRLVLWMMTPNIFRRPQDVNEISHFIMTLDSQPNNDVTIISKKNLNKPNDLNSKDKDDEEEEDDDAGLSNKTLKAMQIFIFIAIFGIVGYFAYKTILGKEGVKSNDKNELDLKKENKDDDIILVDSLRTESNILFDEDNKETKTEEELKEEKRDTSQVNTNLPKVEVSEEKNENKEIDNQPQQTTEPKIDAQKTNQVSEPELQSETNSSKPDKINSDTKPLESNNADNKPQKIIVGSFKNIENANAQLIEVKKSGFNATLESKGEDYRIVISKPNSEEAKKTLDKLKGKYSDAWIE